MRGWVQLLIFLPLPLLSLTVTDRMPMKMPTAKNRRKKYWNSRVRRAWDSTKTLSFPFLKRKKKYYFFVLEGIITWRRRRKNPSVHDCLIGRIWQHCFSHIWELCFGGTCCPQVLKKFLDEAGESEKNSKNKTRRGRRANYPPERKILTTEILFFSNWANYVQKKSTCN